MRIPIWVMSKPEVEHSPKVVIKCAGKYRDVDDAMEFLEGCLVAMGQDPDGYGINLEYIEEK